MIVIFSLFAVLICLVGALYYRALWAQLSARRRRALILIASLAIVASAVMFLSGWFFSSAWANAIMMALGVGGYTLLVLLLTLYRPRILTGCAAALLLLPVPIVSIVLSLFTHALGPLSGDRISADLLVKKVYWDQGALGSAGVTLLIVNRPRLIPIIEHRLRKIVIEDGVCRPDLASVVLKADGRHVLIHCPWAVDLHKHGSEDLVEALF